jgi:hypothetical protein
MTESSYTIHEAYEELYHTCRAAIPYIKVCVDVCPSLINELTRVYYARAQLFRICTYTHVYTTYSCIHVCVCVCVLVDEHLSAKQTNKQQAFRKWLAEAPAAGIGIAHYLWIMGRRVTATFKHATCM